MGTAQAGGSYQWEEEDYVEMFNFCLNITNFSLKLLTVFFSK